MGYSLEKDHNKITFWSDNEEIVNDVEKYIEMRIKAERYSLLDSATKSLFEVKVAKV